MNKCFIILISVLFISSSAYAQDKINKTKYDYHTLSYQVGDPYNPSVAGVTSFLMPGHGVPIPSELINDQIGYVKLILKGTCQLKEYKSFVGNSMICTSGRASLAYNPENLKNIKLILRRVKLFGEIF